MKIDEATLHRLQSQLSALGHEIQGVLEPPEGPKLAAERKAKARSRTLMARLHKRNLSDATRRLLLEEAITQGHLAAFSLARSLPWQEESLRSLDPSTTRLAFEGLPWLPADPVARNLWLLLRLARLGSMEQELRDTLPALHLLTGAPEGSQPQGSARGVRGLPTALPPPQVRYRSGGLAADASVALYPDQSPALAQGTLYLPGGVPCLRAGVWSLPKDSGWVHFDAGTEKGRGALWAHAANRVPEATLRRAWALAGRVWPEQIWFFVWELAFAAR